MMATPTETSFAVAMSRQDVFEERVSTLRRDMSAMTLTLDKLSGKIDMLSNQLSQRRDCPMPGKCLELDRRMTAVETKVVDLEGTRQRAAGMLAGVTVVGGVLGALATKLGSILFKP